MCCVKYYCVRAMATSRAMKKLCKKEVLFITVTLKQWIWRHHLLVNFFLLLHHGRNLASVHFYKQKDLLLVTSMHTQWLLLYLHFQYLKTNVAVWHQKPGVKIQYPYLVSPKVGIRQWLEPLVSRSFAPLGGTYMLLLTPRLHTCMLGHQNGTLKHSCLIIPQTKYLNFHMQRFIMYITVLY